MLKWLKNFFFVQTKTAFIKSGIIKEENIEKSYLSVNNSQLKWHFKCLFIYLFGFKCNQLNVDLHAC
jgi:hypothetical protein